MSTHRWAAKRDAAEPAIVEALEAVGAFVVRISSKDAPDLLVRYRGRWFVLEVKSGKRQRTKGQAAAGYPVVRTPVEALAVVGAPWLERSELLRMAMAKADL